MVALHTNVYILTLTSLNDTFLEKNLAIPFAPDSLKLGRPAGSKVLPKKDNGFFDSRVLSRNHASFQVDPASGKICITDLGSSNGTFINGDKIVEPHEVKIGDQIDLGFDIEMTQNHKKISAVVENIQLRPLTSQRELIFTSHPSRGVNGAQMDELAFDNALF
ncbi:hypothetical protein BABINDRAFT_35456, partial [Babjeviella inositovora NRRL Y-12698]